MTEPNSNSIEEETGEEITESESVIDDSEQELEDEEEIVTPIVEKKKVYTKDYPLHNIEISTTERFCKSVESPEAHVLTDEEFYNSDGLPNVDLIMEHLRKEGRVSMGQLMKLIHEVHEIFCAEDNVLMVEAPLTVCGDIHGQYYDLLKLFEVGGDPKSTQYLFLGDYVDRGNFSIECVILLFCYKLIYPTGFWMIRGNHECRHLTDYFTFKEECEYKYDYSVYEAVMDTFDALPLAAIMNKQFFCVHGGLSPQVQTIEQIDNIDRFNEPPSSGPMCDLLWADPMEDFSGDYQFEFNSVRGCSFNFGFGAVSRFLENNKLLSIIRAHEAQDAGYRMYRRNDKTGFPSVITLFSAPNYLDSYNNKGAVLRYENNVINIRQFNHSPHPYYLPGFMNVFAWSLPFVAEKMAEILMIFLKLVDDVEAEQVEKAEQAERAEQQEKSAVLRSKIRGVTRMLHILQKMRKEREVLVKAGSLSPDGVTLSPNLSDSLSSPENNKRLSISSPSLSSFEAVREMDRLNEARPASPRSDASPLRSSQDGLKRRISRDNILFAKRSSGERMNIQEILKQTPRTAPQNTPQIKEDKVADDPT